MESRITIEYFAAGEPPEDARAIFIMSDPVRLVAAVLKEAPSVLLADRPDRLSGD